MRDAILDAPTAIEVMRWSAAELDRAMRTGGPIDLEVLADGVYDGISLNLPKPILALTWLKFQKVFAREPDGSLRGWNAKILQSPIDAPWELETKRGRPMTYGHYRVRPASDYAMPRPYGAGGVLLDYGLGVHPRFDPTARVRDPLVALDDTSELLLGWTYLDLGVTRVGTPSFFLLRRSPTGRLADFPAASAAPR